MTAQKDVEQMRWCHIRSMENTQIVDSENLNLRRIIVGKKISRTASLAFRLGCSIALTSGFYPQHSDLRRRNAEVEGTMSNCIKLLREEMSQLRIVHSQECAHTNMSFEVMKKATAKFLDMACDEQNRISALCDANDVVSQSLSDLTASNLQEKVRRQKALTNSESKILKLRDSLIVIETDNSKLMKENDDSKDSMIQLSSKNDVLVAECVRLKAKNAKTETDCEASVVDAVKNQNVLKIACDEVEKIVCVHIILV